MELAKVTSKGQITIPIEITLGLLAIWAFLVDTPVCELSAETVH